QRHVKVWLNLLGFCSEVDDFIMHQIGLYRGKSDAMQPVNPIQGLEQLKKVFISIATEIAGIHPGYYNLFKTFFNQCLGILYYRRNFWAPAFATGEWNGAKGAFITTAVLYLQKSTGAVICRKSIMEIHGFVGI